MLIDPSWSWLEVLVQFLFDLFFFAVAHHLLNILGRRRNSILLSFLDLWNKSCHSLCTIFYSTVIHLQLLPLFLFQSELLHGILNIWFCTLIYAFISQRKEANVVPHSSLMEMVCSTLLELKISLRRWSWGNVDSRMLWCLSWAPRVAVRILIDRLITWY